MVTLWKGEGAKYPQVPSLTHKVPPSTPINTLPLRRLRNSPNQSQRLQAANPQRETFTLKATRVLQGADHIPGLWRSVLHDFQLFPPQRL